MSVEIRENLVLQLHGCSGTASNKDYAATAFRLMDKMWSAVKQNAVKNKGLNIHIYGANDEVFAGVELLSEPGECGLEARTVSLVRYAYFKHTGPYRLIREAGTDMRSSLKAKGLRTGFPYIEIYGHWTSDESKLETELLMNLNQ